MTFERTWFRCSICEVPCDLSVLAPAIDDDPREICKVCEASYCPMCGTGLKPVIPRGYGLTVFCPECGYEEGVSREVYENIKQLNGEKNES